MDRIAYALADGVTVARRNVIKITRVPEVLVAVLISPLIMVLLFGLGVIYTHWWGVLGVFLLAEIVGWSIRFQYIGPLLDWLTHTVTALGRTGERSTASLLVTVS